MTSLHKRITTLQGEYVQNFERVRIRLFTVAVFFGLAFMIVSLRLVYLMGPGILADDDVALSTTPSEVAAPKRLDIVDRNGILVATSLKTESLFADPKLIADPRDLALRLAAIFPDLNAENLYNDLIKKRRFVWIKRHLTPKQQAAVLEIGDPALNVQSEYRRIYPQGNLLSHILGYTNIDGIGIAGIENQYDKQLLKSDTPLTLTIDIRLQDVLRSEMQKSIKNFDAIGGSGIVMDVKNGEILAMVSLPDFDPHNYADAPADAMFNRNTVGVYEMGSTFKTFATAAAIENGATRLDTLYDIRKPLEIGGFRIHDYHPMKRKITATEVFIHSSNIGTAKMALKLGTEKLKTFFDDLGFFSKIKVDLPERGTPLVPSPWREVHTVTTAYGHGIAVTPLHLVRATAAMVNGGTLPYPHLVHNETLADKPQVAVISPKTSKIMAALLALTVEKGTGSKAAHESLWIGGKTGTAEKIGADGTYDSEKLLSSFIGIFPADNPRYVVFVSIDEPKGTKKSFGYATGGWTSAPVVGEVIAHMKATHPELNRIVKQPFPMLKTLAAYVKEDKG